MVFHRLFFSYRDKLKAALLFPNGKYQLVDKETAFLKNLRDLHYDVTTTGYMFYVFRPQIL